MSDEFDFTEHYHRGVLTSILAHRDNWEHFKSLRKKVNALVETSCTPEFIASAGFYGLTLDEGTAIFESITPTHHDGARRLWWNSIGPRFGELVRDGDIVRLAQHRLTRRRVPCYIHVTRDYWKELGFPEVAKYRGK